MSYQLWVISGPIAVILCSSRIILYLFFLHIFIILGEKLPSVLLVTHHES